MGYCEACRDVPGTLALPENFLMYLSFEWNPACYHGSVQKSIGTFIWIFGDCFLEYLIGYFSHYISADKDSKCSTDVQ